MLAGAVMGFAVAVGTRSAWMVVAIAMLAGAALALAHAVLAVTLRAEQVTADSPRPLRGRALRLPGETVDRHPNPRCPSVPCRCRICGSIPTSARCSSTRIPSST